MASLQKWWEVFSAKKKPKKKTPVLHPSRHFPLVGPRLTRTSYMGITDNGAGLLCVPGMASSPTCAMFSPTITKPLWKLSCNCGFFQAWQEAIKAVQKYERCGGGVSRVGRRLKGTKGTGAASFITQAKGQGFITGTKRSSGNMCGILSGHLLMDNITQTLVRVGSCITSAVRGNRISPPSFQLCSVAVVHLPPAD